MENDGDNMDLLWILIFHHAWLEIDAYLEWLIELELWKLKSEIKDLLLVAFSAKQTPPAKKLCMSS